jgi:hypothetical protein
MTEDRELIDNFKYKYDEIKYILDMKIKDFNREEEKNKVIIQRFALKLNELEKINLHLKKLITQKEKENEEFIRRLKELDQKINDFEIDSKNNQNFKKVLIEKDVKIFLF